MTGPIYTPSMLASALSHYDRRVGWIRGTCRTTGQQFVQFTSSRKPPKGRQPRVYRCSGESCTCPGYSYHHGVCSHVLAVRMDTEQKRAAAKRPQRNVVTAP